VSTQAPTKEEIKALFERLATAPRHLFEVCSGTSPERMSQPLAPGKWSPVQVIQHLIGCDKEALLPRIEKMLNEEDPFLPAYDQDLWMKQHGEVHNRKPISLMDEYARLREKSVVLLFDLELEDWMRTGQHEENGPITIYDLSVYFAKHDDHHRHQLVDFLA
jgi:uncharacterized damage-inducible protein DinB